MRRRRLGEFADREHVPSINGKPTADRSQATVGDGRCTARRKKLTEAARELDGSTRPSVKRDSGDGQRSRSAPTGNNRLAWALFYAALGIPVFPLAPRGKNPLIPSAHPRGDPLRGKCHGECGREGHGFYDASTDPDTIRRWWTEHRFANVAARTGVAFDVIDLDEGNLEVDGSDGKFEVNVDGATVEIKLSGPIARSGRPSGHGRHVFVEPTGRRGCDKFLPGVDYKGLGGQVVLPPSIHPDADDDDHVLDDADAGRYIWLTDPNQLMELLRPAPAEITEALDKKLRHPSDNARTSAASTTPMDEAVARMSAKARLTAINARLRNEKEGNRHSLLFWSGRVASTLIGSMTREEIERSLRAAAHDCGLDQDPKEDVEGTIFDGIESGLAHPPPDREWEQPDQKATKQRKRTDPSQARVHVIDLFDVAPRPTTWLWFNRIPEGEVTVVEGRKATGKSTVASDIAARVLAGAPMPDATPGIEGNVLYLCGEESLAKTVRRRIDRELKKFGVELRPNQFRVLDALEVDGVKRGFEIPGDLDVIEAQVQSNDKLLVVDVLDNFLGDQVETHNNHSVRRALGPLAALAQKLDLTVIVIRHLRKGQEGVALDQGMGSVGIGGQARSVIRCDHHPDKDELRVFAMVECNVATCRAVSWGYHIVTEFDDHGPIAYLQWTGEEEVTADELAAAKPGRAKEAKQIEEWLDGLLDGGDGEVPAGDVERLGREEGFAPRTVSRVKKKMHLESKQVYDKSPDGKVIKVWKWTRPPIIAR
jgi:hypothetical protein